MKDWQLRLFFVYGICFWLMFPIGFLALWVGLLTWSWQTALLTFITAMSIAATCTWFLLG